MHRTLIIGKIMPGGESQLADIFAESDATDLPDVTGVRHRSLYQLDDLYLHLMETEYFDPARLASARAHPAFVRVNQRLAECTVPYRPNLRSPRDSMAECFYRWDASGPNAR